MKLAGSAWERYAGRLAAGVASRARIAAAALLMLATVASAQEALAPFSYRQGRVSITERSDFSKYVDGRYIGHVYREARLSVDAAAPGPPPFRYFGEALVFEETTRDEKAVARRLSGSVPVEYVVGPAGAMYVRDEGYPILRGIPASPPSAARQGQRWTGEGAVVVRPRPDRPATRIGVLVEYEYAGTSTYAGRAAKSIKARYALRYRGGDRLGDQGLLSVEGGRVADIVVDSSDGSTLFVRETVDESYGFSDGPAIKIKGFILHFHAPGSDADRDRIAAALDPKAAPEPAAPGKQGGAGPVGAASAPPPAAQAAGGAPQGAASPDTSSPGPVSGGPATPGSGGPPPGEYAAIERAAPLPGSAVPYELGRSERGVVLLLYDLRFAADSDLLLSSEKARLDAIAAALARIQGKTFLVEGHAADLGKAAGQYELSERRAKRVVDELASRGLPAGRFIYRGLGADKPVAPNDTEANRARNRRVEITILD